MFYSAILLLLTGLLVSLLFVREDVDVTMVRLPGQMFETEGENIKNVYTFKVINKTINDIENIELKLINHKGDIVMIGGNTIVRKQNLAEGTIFILIPKKDLKSSKESIKVGIYSNGELIETAITNFPGPLKVTN